MTESKSKLHDSITGVVLAGGRSSRMGTDKARLKLQEKTLVEWSVEVLRRCFPTTMVIANDPAVFPGAVPDDVPGLGPLGAIATALRCVSTPGIFVVACDMPFLNVDLIGDMARQLAGWDAVAVRGEQLHAAYSRSLLPFVEQQIAAGDLSVHGLLERVRVRHFTEMELAKYPDWRRSFFNVNTPEEFEQAKKMMK